ncbi:hypothetical protein ACFX13_017425 [Malus domestica]
MGFQGASGCLMELRLAGVASCDVDSGLSASGFYGEGKDGLGLREMEGRLGFRKDEEEWGERRWGHRLREMKREQEEVEGSEPYGQIYPSKF